MIVSLTVNYIVFAVLGVVVPIDAAILDEAGGTSAPVRVPREQPTLAAAVVVVRQLVRDHMLGLRDPELLQPLRVLVVERASLIEQQRIVEHQVHVVQVPAVTPGS